MMDYIVYGSQLYILAGPLRQVGKNAEERLSVQRGLTPLSLRRSTAFDRFLGWRGLNTPVLEAVNHMNVYEIAFKLHVFSTLGG